MPRFLLPGGAQIAAGGEEEAEGGEPAGGGEGGVGQAGEGLESGAGFDVVGQSGEGADGDIEKRLLVEAEGADEGGDAELVASVERLVVFGQFVAVGWTVVVIVAGRGNGG